MVKLDDAIIARYEHAGHRFEILVDPDSVDKIKTGKFDLEDDLASDMVFKDAKKGDKAGEELVKEIFGTNDIIKVAQDIVKNGQIQLTTEQRKKMQESKKKMIIDMIVREGINPQTNAPNPPARIEAAMEEARIHIDPFKPVNEQMNMVLKEIKPLIPIRMEKVKLAIKVRGDAYGKLYGEISRSGQMIKEEWGNDGHWMCVLEVPAGMYGDIMGTIGRKAGDSVEIKKIN
ncbi:MAG: ribosome assembly factor SBDS [Candidatus Thermoplasmatota archaeon]|jgi:ribosome maturation protein SDO1|nr:ribosome assembly factor SBDS [Candidatus Thermoplasmatota archaeon]MCL5988336.1 ribosome assembly factor SBDS [Candidatus Thermoplasmatota archaeon]